MKLKFSIGIGGGSASTAAGYRVTIASRDGASRKEQPRGLMSIEKVATGNLALELSLTLMLRLECGQKV